MVQAPLKSSSLTSHQLSNGLTIVAEQVSIDVVNFSLWLDAGSAVEADSINGMAHFLEHMVFKGTAQLQSGEFEHLIEQRGGVMNAATSHDYTYYYMTVAPQDFAAGAIAQIDLVLNASIPEAAFEQERLVILEEIRRAQDNPRRQLFEQAMKLGYCKLPYRRPVLGSANVVKQLTLQQMRQFHQSWYQPQSITAVVVGNLPVEQLIQAVEDKLTSVPQGQLPARPQWQLDPPFLGITRQELADERLQQARLIMLWRVPGLAQREQTYALDMLAQLLGQGRTSRLVQDLREARGWVSNISVSNAPQVLQGVFYVSAQLPTDAIPAVEAAIAQHIKVLQTEQITTTELVQAQTCTANGFVFNNEAPANRANLYGYYQATLKNLAPALDYPAQIRAVTPEEIQTAAQRYLSAEAYGVVVLKPRTDS